MPLSPLIQRFVFIVACIITLLATTTLADRDPNRDVLCVAKQINVSKTEYEKCFDPVQPARSHAPSGARQRTNKAILLPCLQKANPSLTNRILDKAMDACRPEGAIRN